MYETQRQCGRAGSSASLGCGIASERQDLPRSCRTGWSFSLVEKLASFSSTKAASCCNLCGDALGLRAGKRRCSTHGIATTASRRSVRSPFRLVGANSACTSIFRKRTCERNTSFDSCATFIGNWVRRLSWCGIDRVRIARPLACCNSARRDGCASNGFRHTPPTSIRLSNAGTTPNTPTWRTTYRPIPHTSVAPSKSPSRNNEKTTLYSTPTFKPLNCVCDKAHLLRKGQ